MPNSFQLPLKKKILLVSFLIAHLECGGQNVSVNSYSAFQWRDAPVYLSGSFFYSRHERFGEQAFPAAPGGTAGLYFDYALKQKFPFRAGLEVQLRSFSLDSDKEGITNTGKRFLQSTKGNTRMLFFQLPMLLDVLPQLESRKIRVLAGPGLGVRIWSRQSFSYRFEIPSDTLVIMGEESSGSDAMDLLEFNALAAILYNPFDRFEIGLSFGYKLFGFSTGKENFIRRTELNTALGITAFFQVCRMGDLKFRR